MEAAYDPSPDPSGEIRTSEPDAAESDGAWSGDDLEAAYLRALEAIESVEWPGGVPEPEADVEFSREPVGAGGSPALCSVRPAPELKIEAPASSVVDSPGSVAGVSFESDSAAAINLARILEAALFVGGNPLPTKRLCGLSGSDSGAVERVIDELNARYAQQGRPYEIRLGDGGYRLLLRSEFESVRNKVHGVGPREVRLSQDALEVLALVAYRQPISHAQMEASGKKNVAGLLRQLLRRELIAIHRTGSGRTSVAYQTTHRFLALFGLGSLDELPQADELNLR